MQFLSEMFAEEKLNSSLLPTDVGATCNVNECSIPILKNFQFQFSRRPQPRLTALIHRPLRLLQQRVRSIWARLVSMGAIWLSSSVICSLSRALRATITISLCRRWSTSLRWLPSSSWVSIWHSRHKHRSSSRNSKAIRAAFSMRTTSCGRASRPCSRSSPSGASRLRNSILCRERMKVYSSNCTICVSKPSQSSTPTFPRLCITRTTI